MGRILTANELRSGHIVKYENELYKVEKYDPSNQPRGGLTTKLVLKNIKTNATITLSVDAALKFEAMNVTQEEFEYLYDDEDSIFTSDGQDFPLSKVQPGLLELISQGRKFTVISFDDEIYAIVLPQKATVTIKATEPLLRGQTARSTYKPATLSNGWTIQVPVFVEEGDEVIIDTTDVDNPKYDSKPA